ncbi:hypothetical protein V8C42DRAFT_187432 [Trichoderma barbatum]
MDDTNGAPEGSDWTTDFAVAAMLQYGITQMANAPSTLHHCCWTGCTFSDLTPLHHMQLTNQLPGASSATKTRWPEPVPVAMPSWARRLGVPPLETAADTRPYFCLVRHPVCCVCVCAELSCSLGFAEGVEDVLLEQIQTDSSYDYDAASWTANLPSPLYPESAISAQGGFLFLFHLFPLVFTKHHSHIRDPDPGKASGQPVHAYEYK